MNAVIAPKPAALLPTLPTFDKSKDVFSMNAWFWWGSVSLVLLSVLCGFVPGSNGTSSDGGAILAIITGTAVVIERVLEAFWNFQDSTAGAWWPFNLIHKQIDARVNNFSTYITPYVQRLDSLHKKLEQAQQGDAEWKARAQALADQVKQLPDQIEEIRKDLEGAGVGNDQKLDFLLGAAGSRVSAFISAYPGMKEELGKDADLAKTITDDVYAFAESFKDNPARRIISLLAGCLLGLGVAAALQLDVFKALGVHSAAFGFWSLGVPLTGLIMGLGSNPTHELISAIQQYKERKAAPTSA